MPFYFIKISKMIQDFKKEFSFCVDSRVKNVFKQKNLIFVSRQEKKAQTIVLDIEDAMSDKQIRNFAAIQIFV